MSRPIVAITRPADRSKAACKIVEELGGQYVLAPTLDLKPVNSESLKNLIANKDLLDWIVFTSPTTITSLNLFYPDFLKNLDCKVAVIGNKTGKIAGEQGFKVDLIPEDFTAEGLLEDYFATYEGVFDKNEVGFGCRTESESVKKDKELNEYRKFVTPYGKEEYFYWHISFPGNYPGRIHFLPDPEHRVGIVGYIGKHLPTSKFSTI